MISYKEYCQKAWYKKEKKYYKALDYLQLQPGQKVLDIGCGMSPLLGLIQNKGCFAAGVDCAQEAVEFASAKNKCFALRAEATHLPFKDSYFDRVAMLDLVEELDKDKLKKAFSEAKRVLSGQGRLVIHSPNRWGNWLEYSSIRYIEKKTIEAGYFRRDYTQANILSLPALIRLLKESGFKVKFWFCGPSLLEDKTGLLRKIANSALFFLTAIWIRAAKIE